MGSSKKKKKKKEGREKIEKKKNEVVFEWPLHFKIASWPTARQSGLALQGPTEQHQKQQFAIYEIVKKGEDFFSSIFPFLLAN